MNCRHAVPADRCPHCAAEDRAYNAIPRHAADIRRVSAAWRFVRVPMMSTGKVHPDTGIGIVFHRG